ncbi:MAG: COX15/CtaA family protein [Sandaracinus sp.]|nr:COX15/CtaA family protein [Sandaracinus sp.]MCB9615950.1 COX15/CtaA family protein [Sandaracinus sp.]MCB9621396.1 COX15/CtaA family protein [Sandaracinus sp.]MCB9635273.1 COX15/CtaA family protein [Sandaracinus sp.]
MELVKDDLPIARDAGTELSGFESRLPEHDADARELRFARRWLVVIYAMILGMVALGGVTRLTGSGLSMVAWEPTRVLPPLNETEWAEELARYRSSPQGRESNAWMELDDFRRIFAWEYAHRLAGRLLGVVTFVPLLVLTWRRRLPRGKLGAGWALLALGGLQGALGWWMVKSGLVDQPEVDHFRLAAHLALAFFAAHVALFLAIRWGANAAATPNPSRGLRVSTWVALVFVCAQVVWGALVAGKRAGLSAPTFPDFFGRYAPSAVLGDAPRWLEDPLALHYVHRVIALALVANATALVAQTWSTPRLRRSALGVLAALFVQIGVGAWVVLAYVPTGAAVLHQVVGFGVVSHLVAFATRAGVLGRPSSVARTRGEPAM